MVPRNIIIVSACFTIRPCAAPVVMSVAHKQSQREEEKTTGGGTVQKKLLACEKRNLPRYFVRAGLASVDNGTVKHAAHLPSPPPYSPLLPPPSPPPPATPPNFNKKGKKKNNVAVTYPKRQPYPGRSGKFPGSSCNEDFCVRSTSMDQPFYAEAGPSRRGY